jgi:hypothetical protein
MVLKAYLLCAAALLAAPLQATAGTWQRLTNTPAFPDIIDPTNGADEGPGGAGVPILLTDGTIILQNNGYGGVDGSVWRLTPDQNGSYVNGTWSTIAKLPYTPSTAAEAVLADGRVIVEGGEYSGIPLNFLLTNQGAIYDPVANTWTPVTPPAFFKDLYPPRAKFAPHPIGDSASAVLANGLYVLADKMSHQAAILNPKTMTWTQVGTASKSDLNDEEGWTLLPDGKLLTIDCYTDYAFMLIPTYPANPTNSEIFNPATLRWASAGSTINTLTDPNLFETGPAILRPNGTAFFVGSQGNTAIYTIKTASWAAGPALPLSPQGNRYTAEDGPAALLPNGNVLVAATGGAGAPGNYAGPPVGFFEFDGTSLTAEATIPNAKSDTSSSISLIVLPTGQILETDGTNDIEIYTPATTTYSAGWAPEIVAVPTSVTRGQSYTLSAIRLNGMSQASAFGDENQNATNYPLVRITNTATGHVFYARTHDHTSMAVASPVKASTTFDIPTTMETGPSTLQTVANGIPSKPRNITVL